MRRHNRMPVPRSVVVRNFTVVSTTPVPGGNLVLFCAFHGTPHSFGPLLRDAIRTGDLHDRSVHGVGRRVDGDGVRLETGAVPSVSYAYELWSPTAVSAAVLAEAKVNSAEATGPLPALMR